MMRRTGLRAAILHSSTIAFLALTLAACGGGGGSIKLPPTGGAPDDHSDTTVDATIVRGGGSALGPRGGQLWGAIDEGGDVDVFRFEGRPGVTYVLRGHTELAGVPQPLARLTIDIFDELLQELLATNDETLAEVEGQSPFRVAFTPPVRATYFIRIGHENVVTGTGNYRLILTSSEIALKGPLEVFENLDPRFAGTNLRVAGDRVLTVEYMDMLENRVVSIPPFASLFQANLVFIDPDLVLFPELRYSASIPQFFLDPMATDPDTPVVHLHFGSPAVGAPTGFFDPNLNKMSDAEEPHGVFLELDLAVNTLELSRADWALLVGYENYIDVHVSDNLEAVPAPIAQTPIMSGFDLFESEFRLTGSQAVPPTGVNTEDCTILLLQDQQAFQWDFERFDFGGLIVDEIKLEVRNNPPLTILGLPINVRSGFPGEEGPILVSLGNVVAPVQDGPNPGSLYPIGPRDRKNIQYVMSDREWQRIRNLIYDNRDRVITVNDVQGNDRQVTYLGWYIEVENGGVSVVRADAAQRDDEFLMGWEGAFTDPAPTSPRFSDADDSPGEVTFVTDYGDGGLVSVSVNDKFLSQLNAAFSGRTPECGEGSLGETVRALYDPGTYSYTAVADDGTSWQGTVEVPAGGSCVTVALLESEAL